MITPEKSYHKLLVYQKAKELVLITYQLTKKFPKEELYVLVSQMRRAAISVMANIGEGYAKNSTAEFVRYLDISLGSLTELEIFFELVQALEYLSNSDNDKAQSSIYEVKKLLYAFQFSLKRKRDLARK